MEKLKDFVFGHTKNLQDPQIFHKVSLIAFLAWVGLGADGLSSSCYGPEEAYLALRQYHHLALYLAITTAVTVFIISASYSQIIELFPTGGGGYLVATKLLGSHAGLVSGCALVVDYVLTISISVASGMDAIFSFLPIGFLQYKLLCSIAMILFLIILNMRGVKESVTLLVPIFLVFVITHFIIVTIGIFGHTSALPGMLVATGRESYSGVKTLGFFAILVILMRAYSLGGGTYTGIEAVSNGIQILREPKVQTAKRTMIYMSVSLAFTAGGIILSYLLNHIMFQQGKTMNAVLVEQIAGSWSLLGLPIGSGFVLITLISEGLLLFVAAQTGFLDGPRVLSNMAHDSWVPRRFSHLSDRLVTQNGILLMGLSALAILLYTKGDVGILVVLYSINVFLTFSLSQLGMCVHWWQARKKEKHWRKRIWINGVGLCMTFGILIVTTFIKFGEGGWVTVAITSVFIVLCLLINKHYRNVYKVFKKLDDTLINIPLPDVAPPIPPKNAKSPTAVLMVNGFNGLGIHSLMMIIKSFRKQFTNIVFVTVGVVDSTRFKGVEELSYLKEATEEGLKKYVEFANKLGLYAEYRYSIGTDAIDELDATCKATAKEFPNAVFFAGKLIFPEENWVTRLLHNQAALSIQQRLLFDGIQMMVLPIRAF